MRHPILSPAEAGSLLFNVKSDLERLRFTLEEWRQSGMNGTGLVPVKMLPLEPKVLKALLEVEQLLKMLTELPNFLR